MKYYFEIIDKEFTGTNAVIAIVIVVAVLLFIAVGSFCLFYQIKQKQQNNDHFLVSTQEH